MDIVYFEIRTTSQKICRYINKCKKNEIKMKIHNLNLTTTIITKLKKLSLTE